MQQHLENCGRLFRAKTFVLGALKVTRHGLCKFRIDPELFAHPQHMIVGSGFNFERAAGIIVLSLRDERRGASLAGRIS